MDAEGKAKGVDGTLDRRGWIVLRFKVGNITDGKEEADIIHKAVKERKRAIALAKKKKKKKPAAPKK
jgi:predicted RNase H-like nuclease